MKKMFSIALMLCFVCTSMVSATAAADDGLEQFNDLAQSIMTMDPDVSQEQIDSLLAQLEALDLDGEEDQNALTGSMVGGDRQNIQLLFAQLQMQLAQSNKEQALERINAIRASQEQSAQITEYIHTARQLHSETETGKAQAVPGDMLQFLQDNSLYTPQNASAADEKDWQAILQSLQSFQERIDSDVQQQMTFIQDFMGQYNQYISQTSSLFGSGSVQGLSGSATMLGAGGAGLAVTALVAGLAVGSLATVLILRRKQNKT